MGCIPFPGAGVCTGTACSTLLAWLPRPALLAHELPRSWAACGPLAERAGPLGSTTLVAAAPSWAGCCAGLRTPQLAPSARVPERLAGRGSHARRRCRRLLPACARRRLPELQSPVRASPATQATSQRGARSLLAPRSPPWSARKTCAQTEARKGKCWRSLSTHFIPCLSLIMA